MVINMQEEIDKTYEEIYRLQAQREQLNNEFTDLGNAPTEEYNAKKAEIQDVDAQISDLYNRIADITEEINKAKAKEAEKAQEAQDVQAAEESTIKILKENEELLEHETREQAFQRIMGFPYDPNKYEILDGDGAYDVGYDNPISTITIVERPPEYTLQPVKEDEEIFEYETNEQAFQRIMGIPFDPNKYKILPGNGSYDDGYDNPINTITIFEKVQVERKVETQNGQGTVGEEVKEEETQEEQITEQNMETGEGVDPSTITEEQVVQAVAETQEQQLSQPDPQMTLNDLLDKYRKYLASEIPANLFNDDLVQEDFNVNDISYQLDDYAKDEILNLRGQLRQAGFKFRPPQALDQTDKRDFNALLAEYAHTLNDMSFILQESTYPGIIHADPNAVKYQLDDNEIDRFLDLSASAKSFGNQHPDVVKSYEVLMNEIINTRKAMGTILGEEPYPGIENSDPFKIADQTDRSKFINYKNNLTNMKTKYPYLFEGYVPVHNQTKTDDAQKQDDQQVTPQQTNPTGSTGDNTPPTGNPSTGDNSNPSGNNNPSSDPPAGDNTTGDQENEQDDQQQSNDQQQTGQQQGEPQQQTGQQQGEPQQTGQQQAGNQQQNQVDPEQAEKAAKIAKLKKKIKKGLGFTAGMAVGVALSCVPGVGTISMAASTAKLVMSGTGAIVKSWTNKHPDGIITKMYKTTNRMIATKMPNVASKVNSIKQKFQSSPLNVFVNGVSAGFIAGNLYELWGGGTVIQSFTQKASYGPIVYTNGLAESSEVIQNVGGMIR